MGSRARLGASGPCHCHAPQPRRANLSVSAAKPPLNHGKGVTPSVSPPPAPRSPGTAARAPGQPCSSGVRLRNPDSRGHVVTAPGWDEAARKSRLQALSSSRSSQAAAEGFQEAGEKRLLISPRRNRSSSDKNWCASMDFISPL